MNIQGWMNMVQVMGALGRPHFFGCRTRLFYYNKVKKIQ